MGELDVERQKEQFNGYKTHTHPATAVERVGTLLGHKTFSATALPNHGKIISWALQELVLTPKKIRVLLGGTVKNTGRLLRRLPRAFLGPQGIAFRLCRVVA